MKFGQTEVATLQFCRIDRFYSPDNCFLIWPTNLLLLLLSSEDSLVFFADRVLTKLPHDCSFTDSLSKEGALTPKSHTSTPRMKTPQTNFVIAVHVPLSNQSAMWHENKVSELYLLKKTCTSPCSGLLRTSHQDISSHADCSEHLCRFRCTAISAWAAALVTAERRTNNKNP